MGCREDEFSRYGCSSTEVNIGGETLNLQGSNERELAGGSGGPSDYLVGGGGEGRGLAEGELCLHPVQESEQTLHSLLQLGRPVDTDLLQEILGLVLA